MLAVDPQAAAAEQIGRIEDEAATGNLRIQLGELINQDEFEQGVPPGR